jgi:amino acid adenylation domain-containing protein
MTISPTLLKPVSQQEAIMRTALADPQALHQAICYIHGSVKTDMLQAACRNVIARHDTFRLRARPSTHDFTLTPAEDLHTWRESLAAQQDWQSLCEAVGKTERDLPIDSQTGPLLRLHCILDETEPKALILTGSALVFDPESLVLITHDIADQLNNRLSEAASSFLDYAVWQHDILNDPAGVQGRPYWRSLPAENPGIGLMQAKAQADHTDAVEWFSVQIASDVWRSLAELARQNELRVQSLVASCWHVVLSRLRRSGHWLLGYDANGRSFDALQSCIGPLTKTMPLQAHALGHLDLIAAARNIQQSIDLAEAWQDGFDPRSDWPNAAHQPDRERFGFIALDAARLSAGAVSFTCMGIHIWDPASTAKLALVWDAGQETGACVIGYRRDAFSHAMVEALADSLSKTIRDWSNHPARSGYSLAWTSQDAFRHEDGQRPEFSFQNDLFSAFQQRCSAHPDHVAIRHATQSVSYRSLAQRADRLAERLADVGGRRGDVIGIYLNRSVELVAAILAIHKLGAAYLVLDPQQPLDYVKSLLSDAAVPVLISNRPLLNDLGARPAAFVLVDDLDITKRGTARIVHRKPDAMEAAYVIYTSGSTGVPKGVVVSQAALANYVAWACHQYNLDDIAGCLVHTSATVDLTITALLSPLYCGGTLLMPEHAEDARGALEFLRAGNDCALLKLTPSHLSILNTELDIEKIRTQVKMLVIGGERLPASLVKPWIGPDGPSIFNEYGPTEATVACSLHAVHLADQDPVPIGTAICGAWLHLCDWSGDPVASGFSGEIAIGGPGLALGYRNRPGLTAERFIPSLFGKGGERCYLTGDLAYPFSSGDLVYTGRKDRQVKIGGFRIELDHVEAMIQHHPSIKEAATALIEEDSRKTLVAWIVAQEGQDHLTDLTAYLINTLPRAMVPNLLVPLQSMPMTQSGKIDRKALARLAETKAARHKPYLAPRTEVEHRIAAIWSDVLKLQTIGIEDDFFALGGHSILAVNILFEIRKAFARDLPLAAIFDNPTIAGLAQAVEKAAHMDGAVVPLPQVRHDAQGRYQPFAMTDVQQAYWIGQTDAYALGNVGAHAYQEIEFVGLDTTRMQWAFRQLIDRHDMLRMITRDDGTQQVQRDVPDYTIAIHDLRGQSRVDQEHFIAGLRQKMSHQVFGVGQWPLFAMCGCRIDDERVRLHLSVDALLADAWSFEVLLRDFGRLYTDPDTPLEPLEITFRDYVTTMIGSREDATYQRARDYWLGRVPTLPEAPQLPLKMNLEEVTAPHFERRRFIMSADEWTAIKNHGQREGLTPSAIMLTAFGMVLSHWSANPHFTITLTVFDRPTVHPQINKLVGDFTSLILLEFEPFEGSFLDGARKVQRRLMEALDHRYFDGVQVLRELARRRPDRTPPPMPIVFTSTLTQERREDATFLLSQQVDSMGINQTPQIYLDHQVTEIDGELRFNWDAVEAVFAGECLDEMFDVYCRLLKSLTHPEGWTTQPDLNPAGLTAHYDVLNATAASYPTGTVIERILSHARTAEQAPALYEKDKTLSYGELIHLSSQIGQWLAETKAAADAPVAIVLKPGWQQIASVLGAHLAGLAYLPIDAEQPQTRLFDILESSRVSHVITTCTLSAALSMRNIAGTQFHWDHDALPGFDGFPTPRANPDALAYVITTSGSTGKPKGVAIEQRALMNRMHDMNERLQLTPQDRAIAITALHHDLSVFDIFGLLAAGGSIVLPGSDGHRDPAAWLAAMRAHAVTLWNSVPAFLDMFLHAGLDAQALNTSSLRAIMLSGDRIRPDLLRRAQEAFPNTRLFSLGGPTETTVWDIWHPIDEHSFIGTAIPYGRPLNNARYYVLDDNLRLRPNHVPGELCIAGTGLARGYWNDPERTAQAFVNYPATGERIYRSGDIGRLRSDGQIDILGRRDHQVKLNGQRIELGEVEHALRQHEKIREAAAAIVTGQDGKSMLAAWVGLGQDGMTALLAPQQQAENVALADEQPEPGEGMIVDQITRIEFKMQEKGVRRFEQTHRRHAFQKTPPTPEHLAKVMRRRSDRQFSDQPVSIAALGHLLESVAQTKPDGFALAKYRYPSAGNAYPIQTYLLARPDRVAGLEGGAFYHDPKTHELVRLHEDGDWADGLHPPNNRPVSQQAALTLFLVVDWDAIRPLYGEKSYDFSLLEAGYIGQLLMSEGPDFGLGLCPIGTLEFDALRMRFGLGPNHALLHSFFIGTRLELSDDALTSDSSKRAADWGENQGTPVQDGLMQELRAFAASRLPAGMVPAHITLLADLPRTGSGKLDRSALIAPDFSAIPEKTELIEPRSDLEKALAALWSQILNTPVRSINDDFFRLGGDSILAIQLMNRLKNAFGIAFSLRDMLKANTVETLAILIEKNLAEAATADAGDQP